MPRWSKSDRARIEIRRLNVEQLVVRGFGLYEITERLAEDRGIVNPETGESYSPMTISRDLTEIEERWREDAVEERAKHKADQLAELRAARRAAWEINAYNEVRLNLEAEMRLLGTDEPQAVVLEETFDLNEWRRQRDQRRQNLEDLEGPDECAAQDG